MNHLFSGKTQGFGLSNERELVKECPKEFLNDWHRNPWCDYISHMFFGGVDISNWKWKSQDKDTQTLQRMYLHSLLSGWGLAHELKTAVAGWMLSEMLTECPIYIKPKEKNNEKENMA